MTFVFFRFDISQCTRSQSGSGRGVLAGKGGGKSSASSRTSSQPAGSGQPSPSSRARVTYSPTVVRPMLRLRAISRWLRLSSKVSRSTSLILRMDNLCFATFPLRS